MLRKLTPKISFRTSNFFSFSDETEINKPIDLFGWIVIIKVCKFGNLNSNKSTLVFLMMSSSSSEPSSLSTSGLSGGFSSCFAKRDQSSELKKLCYFIWFQFLDPRRFLGSLSSRPTIRFLAASLTFLGNFSLPSLIFLYRVGMSSEK